MSMFDGQLGRLQKRNGQGALILILQLLKVDNDTLILTSLSLNHLTGFIIFGIIVHQVTGCLGKLDD